MKIIIENEKGEKLEIFVAFEQTMDRIIEALYPVATSGSSKGRIILTNHVFGGR